MNHFAGYTRAVPGGHWAMLRFAHEARPNPVMGEDGAPTVFLTELEAWRAVAMHLLTYFNGDMRRGGETASGALAEAEALFPTLCRQKGSNRATAVEYVKRRARA